MDQSKIKIHIIKSSCKEKAWVLTYMDQSKIKIHIIKSSHKEKACKLKMVTKAKIVDQVED